MILSDRERVDGTRVSIGRRVQVREVGGDHRVWVDLGVLPSDQGR